MKRNLSSFIRCFRCRENFFFCNEGAGLSAALLRSLRAWRFAVGSEM